MDHTKYPPQPDETIAAYFQRRLGVVSSFNDDNMPCDCPCGQDCVRAIDSAATFIDCMRCAHSPDDRYGKRDTEVVTQIVERCDAAVSTFIYG